LSGIIRGIRSHRIVNELLRRNDFSLGLLMLGALDFEKLTRKHLKMLITQVKEADDAEAFFVDLLAQGDLSLSDEQKGRVALAKKAKTPQ
jgi:hypothetical protein